MELRAFSEILLAVSFAATIYGVFAGKLILKGEWILKKKD
jgi:hypothetical protein